MSADTATTQLKFVEKYGLEFPVIPDHDRTVIDAWGVRKVLGVTAERTTFLVDPDGTIAYVWEKVTVEGHAEDVLKTVARLKADRG